MVLVKLRVALRSPHTITRVYTRNFQLIDCPGESWGIKLYLPISRNNNVLSAFRKHRRTMARGSAF